MENNDKTILSKLLWNSCTVITLLLYIDHKSVSQMIVFFSVPSFFGSKMVKPCQLSNTDYCW